MNQKHIVRGGRNTNQAMAPASGSDLSSSLNSWTHNGISYMVLGYDWKLQSGRYFSCSFKGKHGSLQTYTPALCGTASPSSNQKQLGLALNGGFLLTLTRRFSGCTRLFSLQPGYLVCVSSTRAFFPDSPGLGKILARGV